MQQDQARPPMFQTDKIMCRQHIRHTRPKRAPPEAEPGQKSPLLVHEARKELYHGRPKPTHRCDQCKQTFQYNYSLKRHLKRDHLHKKTVFEPYSTFKYFGAVKKEPKKPTTIEGAIEEVIVPHTRLKLVSMNVFTLESPQRKVQVKNGILDSKADIALIAETKFHQHTSEYKVPGYYQAATITRKAGAGGLLVMAKNTINPFHSGQKCGTKHPNN